MASNVGAPDAPFLFQDLVSPVGVVDFLRDSVSKREPRLIPGERDKFERLFDWADLNRALLQHRVEPPRVRVERVGATPAELTVVDYVPTPRGIAVPRINPDLLSQRLDEGCTLVFDAINEASFQVGQLAQDVARVFAARGQTNLYASFGETPGFSPHWDSRDVFAVQVEGEKSWKVFRPHRVDPLYRDFHDREAEPGELWWEGTLSQGDVLFVPRGWWHEVRSIGTPSLHLTVGADPVTGLDYLSWIIDRLRNFDVFRAELPKENISEGRSAEDALRAVLDEVWEDCSVQAFLDDRRSERSGRSSFSLPYSVDTVKAIPNWNARVQFSVNQPKFEKSDSSVLITANGRQYTVAESLGEVLEGLIDQRCESFGLLATEVANTAGISEADASAVLVALVRQGLLTVDEHAGL